MPTLIGAMRKAVNAGLHDLDLIERKARQIAEEQTTKRSKAPLLARLLLAYPGLKPKAVSQLLKVTPQGARKLLADRGRSVRANAGRGRP
ncbi:MAG: hypothetical protein H0X36_07320 [Sphingomonadaceae bacterium]|nr:hypothetical protein [Sphingomonadaceae bacterium]